MRKRVILILLLVLSCATWLRGEIFLLADYNLSARTSALRSADIALKGEASSLFTNPALLTDIPYLSGGISYDRGFNGVGLSSIYLAMPYQDFSLGFGLASLDYGDFKSYHSQALNTYDEVSANDLMIVGSVAKGLNKEFSAGANLKFYHSELSSYSSSAIGIDLTATYQIIEERAKIALGLYNVGYQFGAYIDSKEDLPTSLKGGFSYKPVTIPLEVGLLSTYRLNGDIEYAVGLEFHPKDRIKLRTGYDFTGSDKEINTGSQSEKFGGASFGASILFNYFSIDISYQVNGELSENWTIAVNSWKLPTKK